MRKACGLCPDFAALMPAGRRYKGDRENGNLPMSLIRQVWLLLLLTLTLAFAGAFGLSMLSARQYLATQLAMKNLDSAQSLAQTLAGQHGDLPTMAATLDRQFEIGFYERLRRARLVRRPVVAAPDARCRAGGG